MGGKACSQALDIVREHSESAIFDAIDPARRVAVIFLLTWFLVRLVRWHGAAHCRPVHLDKPVDGTTARAVGKLLRASAIITAALVCLQTLVSPISGCWPLAASAASRWALPP